MKEIYNQLIVVGNLGQDPELRYTSGNQTPVCEFNIAVWQGQDRPSTWLPVTLWKGTATAAAEQLRKGSRVRFTGKIGHDEWTDRESRQKRTKFKMTAFEFEVLESKGQGQRQYSRDDMGITPDDEEF